MLTEKGNITRHVRNGVLLYRHRP